MTPTEFRNDTKRVVMLRSLLETPVMLEALAVLSASSPAMHEIRSDISPTYAAVRIGHVAGYTEFLVSLHALATHPDDTASIPAEYIREE